jgi:hypothetical protein
MTQPIITGTLYRHGDSGNLYQTMAIVDINDEFEEGDIVQTRYGQCICSSSLNPEDEAIIYIEADEWSSGQKFIQTIKSFSEILKDSISNTVYYKFELLWRDKAHKGNSL